MSMTKAIEWSFFKSVNWVNWFQIKVWHVFEYVVKEEVSFNKVVMCFAKKIAIGAKCNSYLSQKMTQIAQFCGSLILFLAQLQNVYNAKRLNLVTLNYVL